MDLSVLKPASTSAHLEPLNDRQKRLVELIVWQALPFTKAYNRLRIPMSTAYRWARDPLVIGAIKAETDVLRHSVRSQTLGRLHQIANQNKHLNAAVAAAKIIMEETRDVPGVEPGKSVGYVIMLDGEPLQQPARLITDDSQVIDITPQSGSTAHPVSDTTSRGAVREAPQSRSLPDADDGRDEGGVPS